MKQAHSPLPYLAIFLAIALYSVMDAAMKHASIAVGAYSATFLRSLVGIVLVLPLWLREGARWPRRDALLLHVKRGIVVAGMATSFFYALVRLPLAESIALSFIAPLIALFLASVLLGERIGRQAIGASLLGLAGVVVIAIGRVGEQNAHPEAALGVMAVLVSACLYAWNLILQRQQALLARPVEVALFQSAVAGLVLALAAPWLLVVPGMLAWQSIGASALLAVVSLMLASWAYGRAETQALVPFEYSAFLWAALIGWLAFGEAVTPPTMLGAALIVAGCWIAAPRKHHRADRTLGAGRGGGRFLQSLACQIDHDAKRRADSRRRHKGQCHRQDMERIAAAIGGAKEGHAALSYARGNRAINAILQGHTLDARLQSEQLRATPSSSHLQRR